MPTGIIPSAPGMPGYREPSPAEADHAIEQARGEWERMARERLDAGREIPVQEIPRDLAPDSFRASADATADLMRRAQRRSYTVSIDLAAMEAARIARAAVLAASAAIQSEAESKGKGSKGVGGNGQNGQGNRRKPGDTDRGDRTPGLRRGAFLPSGSRSRRKAAVPPQVAD